MIRRPGAGGAGLDLLVLGAGVSGLTAALHAAQRGLRVRVLERELPGGLVVNVGRLDGYPGGAGLSGAELALGLERELGALGVTLEPAAVTEIQLAADERRPHRVQTSAGAHEARKLVLAMGARLRRLEVPGAERLWQQGVSQCAFCDAGLYRGRPVVVVGGGDAALQEALHLSGFASEVTIVHRGERLGARSAYVERAADDPKIRFQWSSEVVAVLGGDCVQGVRLRHLRRDAETEVECAAVFPFIGLVPNGELVPEAIARDEAGALRTDARLETAVPGTYAIGALRAGFPGQLTSAVGDATLAALAAVAS